MSVKEFVATAAERAAKFAKGDRAKGVSSRWLARPNIAPCWKGDHQEWHIEDGVSYQSQLYCRFWKAFINPSGFACDQCKKQLWPEIERWRAHIIPRLRSEKGDQTAQDALVAAAQNGDLTEPEAIELAHEFWPEEVEARAL